jgi:hypothetical protein
MGLLTGNIWPSGHYERPSNWDCWRMPSHYTEKLPLNCAHDELKLPDDLKTCRRRDKTLISHWIACLKPRIMILLDWAMQVCRPLTYPMQSNLQPIKLQTQSWSANITIKHCSAAHDHVVLEWPKKLSVDDFICSKDMKCICQATCCTISAVDIWVNAICYCNLQSDDAIIWQTVHIKSVKAFFHSTERAVICLQTWFKLKL